MDGASALLARRGTTLSVFEVDFFLVVVPIVAILSACVAGVQRVREAAKPGPRPEQLGSSPWPWHGYATAYDVFPPSGAISRPDRGPWSAPPAAPVRRGAGLQRMNR